MSDEHGQPAEGALSSAHTPAKKGGMLKIILLVAIPLLLIGGGAAVFFFTPLGAKLMGKDKAPAEKEKDINPKDLIFFPLPELLVNLNTTDKKKSNFLRLGVKLEVDGEKAQKALELLKPRIVDQFQLYLRELRAEDLQGSAGIQRLREELLKRANAVVAPTKVTNVLFETMLVQ
jgi:flagellar FliL protein